MDIKVLRTFAVTARTLNFRRAAELLFLAQPTVTQHIRLLEEELKVQLFDRNNRRVRLTAAGERFIKYASRLVDTYEEGVADITGWAQGYHDQLVIAASPQIARTTLPRVVKRFTREHPHVEVRVQVLVSLEVPPAVVDGRAHVGLTRVPANSRDLTSYVWHTDPVLLVVPNDAGDLDAPPPDWREVLSSNLLMTHNHPTYWDDLLVAIHNQGIRPRTMEVNLVDITKRFVEEELGVSFLPRSSVWRELMEGRLLEIPTPGLELPVAATHVVYPSAGPTDAAKLFMKVLSLSVPTIA